MNIADGTGTPLSLALSTQMESSRRRIAHKSEPRSKEMGMRREKAVDHRQSSKPTSSVIHAAVMKSSGAVTSSESVSESLQLKIKNRAPSAIGPLPQNLAPTEIAKESSSSMLRIPTSPTAENLFGGLNLCGSGHIVPATSQISQLLSTNSAVPSNDFPKILSPLPLIRNHPSTANTPAHSPEKILSHHISSSIHNNTASSRDELPQTPSKTSSLPSTQPDAIAVTTEAENHKNQTSLGSREKERKRVTVIDLLSDSSSDSVTDPQKRRRKRKRVSGSVERSTSIPQSLIPRNAIITLSETPHPRRNRVLWSTPAYSETNETQLSVPSISKSPRSISHKTSQNQSSADASPQISGQAPTRFKPWTPKMYLELAKQAEQSFPFTTFATQHFRPKTEVIDVFSAIVQIPMLEQIGKQKMKAFREGVKETKAVLKAQAKRDKEELRKAVRKGIAVAKAKQKAREADKKTGRRNKKTLLAGAVAAHEA
ncbi:MAG: hypothetical protein M1827_007235 [Pycnora praestabilis]|nr:MAG: hypothetical protein M1827_007235 [Pycnora praestabilis]